VYGKFRFTSFSEGTEKSTELFFTIYRFATISDSLILAVLILYIYIYHRDAAPSDCLMVCTLMF